MTLICTSCSRCRVQKQANIDLPVGTYEVLPKIEATRNSDAPDVHEVVTKIAEANPQKLRQIGLNYDIANAKGFVELTDEEKKEKERKKKEATDKKKKKLEQEGKEKADYEAWKKEEKAEYETWKKEKASRDAKEHASKPDDKKEEPKGGSAPVPEITIEAASPSTVAESKPAANDQALDPTKDKSSAPKAKDDGDASEDDEPQHTPEDEAPLGTPFATAASSIADGPAPSQAGRGAYAGSVYGDVQATPAPRADASPSDDAPKPWNAVCVIGLRVYSQDPEISIRLVKPKDEEEAALLDVDGSTAAGATM
jgi:hypothetical protein